MTKKYPEVTVTPVVINSKKEYLLSRSFKFKDQWGFHGGHLEYGERIEDTAVRETLEEMGIMVVAEKILGYNQVIKPTYFHKEKHFIQFVVLCRPVDEKQHLKLNEEFSDAKWVSKQQLFKENIAENVKEVMRLLE